VSAREKGERRIEARAIKIEHGSCFAVKLRSIDQGEHATTSSLNREKHRGRQEKERKEGRKHGSMTCGTRGWFEFFNKLDTGIFKQNRKID
jgi:hypothetical protein